jgi:hypothetical protein
MAGSQDPAVSVFGTDYLIADRIGLCYRCRLPRRICGMQTSFFKALVTGADRFFEPGGACEFIVGSAGTAAVL